MLGSDDPMPTGEGAIVMPHLRPSTDWTTIGTTEVDRLVKAAFGARTFNLRRTVSKLIRYGATSAIALGISEAALLVAAAFGINATLSAVIGNLAGIIPSYLMSRYWIWAEAGRQRVGRQVMQYWLTSLVSLAVTSLATGAISSAAPSSGTEHLMVVGGGFLAINFVCWIGKYIVYQRFIFVEAPEA
jgi:putative flippase GtrA